MHVLPFTIYQNRDLYLNMRAFRKGKERKKLSLREFLVKKKKKKIIGYFFVLVYG